MKDKSIDVENSYDFGFTFTDNKEISKSISDPIIEEYKHRLRTIRKIYLPLLEKLNTNTDKPMINWPNRGPILSEKIKELKGLTEV